MKVPEEEVIMAIKALRIWRIAPFSLKYKARGGIMCHIWKIYLSCEYGAYGRLLTWAETYIRMIKFSEYGVLPPSLPFLSRLIFLLNMQHALYLHDERIWHNPIALCDTLRLTPMSSIFPSGKIGKWTGDQKVVSDTMVSITIPLNTV